MDRSQSTYQSRHDDPIAAGNPPIMYMTSLLYWENFALEAFAIFYLEKLIRWKIMYSSALGILYSS